MKQMKKEERLETREGLDPLLLVLKIEEKGPQAKEHKCPLEARDSP